MQNMYLLVVYLRKISLITFHKITYCTINGKRSYFDEKISLENYRLDIYE